jgi:hypothetical protein
VTPKKEKNMISMEKTGSMPINMNRPEGSRGSKAVAALEVLVGLARASVAGKDILILQAMRTVFLTFSNRFLAEEEAKEANPNTAARTIMQNCGYH